MAEQSASIRAVAYAPNGRCATRSLDPLILARLTVLGGRNAWSGRW